MSVLFKNMQIVFCPAKFTLLLIVVLVFNNEILMF